MQLGYTVLLVWQWEEINVLHNEIYVEKAAYYGMSTMEISQTMPVEAEFNQVSLCYYIPILFFIIMKITSCLFNNVC